MTKKAFQDYYPEDLSHCHGCGRLNEEGLQIKSYWDGEESVCIYTPKYYHTAIPGYVYGGLIASLIDCHSTGTAALGVPLEIRGKVKMIKGRRVVVESRLLAEGKICAQGEVVAVQMPENMRPGELKK